MGVLLVCESTEFLLQREDHAAALAALRDHLRENQGNFRLDGELAADDLADDLAGAASVVSR
jgi:hypothetical protein